MQIVIDIPNSIYANLSKIVNGSIASKRILDCVKNGTPLPKEHGRLIDADDIDNHIIGHVDTRSCPTIIEADKENE